MPLSCAPSITCPGLQVFKFMTPLCECKAPGSQGRESVKKKKCR